MRELEIKPYYEHEREHSVFVMFRKSTELVWSFSGNELRRVYLLNPEEFMTGPLELEISEELMQKLTEFIDNF